VIFYFPQPIANEGDNSKNENLVFLEEVYVMVLTL